MKKSRAIELLTITLVITAILTFLAFARFPVGTKNFNGFLGAIQTDYDLSGGTAYTLTLSRDNVKDVDDVDDVINTLKYRLNLLGYENYSVKAVKDVDEAVKDYDIRIEARGNADRFGKVDTATLSSDIKVAAAYGELTFYGGTSQNPTEKILEGGKPVADAYYMGAATDGSSTTYNVNIKFSDYGYDALTELLNANSTYYVQINLGDTVLLPGTSALSSSYINDKSLIITTGSEASARQAALQIKTGGLAYKYDLSEGEEVSSPLGRNLEIKSVIAISALLVAIIAAMFVIDKKYGVVSLLSSVLFTDIYLFLLIAIPGIKLSIGGVIAVALSAVLLADGFMITSKRIKEEFARGKTVKSAVKTGFNRALLPIAGTAGIVAAAALSLFALSGGALKNFALLIAVGVVLAAAINLLISRMFANLILAIVKYNQSFLGLERADKNAEEAGE
ncbi:MAG: hypothetical protein J6Y43_02205 [Clostridia bacterium]|nr:hypothetical protein [Clostridia bacterium]